MSPEERAQERERWRKRMADPVARERERKRQREVWRKKMADPAERKKHNKKVREYQQTLRGRAVALAGKARRRAERDGAACTITVEWVLDALRNGRCQRTGKRFVVQSGRGRHPFAPSIDRIDPACRDYTPDNCQVVCWQYNCAKSEYSHAGLVNFARAVIDVEDGRLDPRTGVYKDGPGVTVVVTDPGMDQEWR